MPFSEEFTYRKKNVSGGQPRAVNISALGVLRFDTSTNHTTEVSYYEAVVEVSGSSTVVKTINLGKPWPTGTVYFDISQQLSALSAGDYNVLVRAVGPNGSASSSESNAFTVPLIPE